MICRLLPLVRAYMSFPAGITRMPYPRFLALSALGGVPWIVFGGILGRVLGSHSVQNNLHYVDIAAVGLIAAAIVYPFIRRRRRRLAA